MKKSLSQIKCFFKQVYLLCHKVYQDMLWCCQYYYARFKKLYPTRLTRLEIDGNKKVIVLTPHADDEWIGTYSVIKRYRANLSCVYFNLFGNDYSVQNKEIRNSEIRASADYWGFKLINNYDYDVNALYEELKDSRICFVPSPFDWHKEHRKVFFTFQEAYRKLSENQRGNIDIYCFCISVPHSNRRHQYYIPLSREEILEKWSLFPKIYHSQAFMPALRYQFQLRLIPKELGYAAQTFVKIEREALLHDYISDAVATNISRLNSAKSLVNNIFSIRQFVDSNQ